MFDRNLHISLFCETGKLFTPFDEQNALRGHQVVKGQGIELALRVDAIKINVEERDLGPRYSWIRVNVGLVTSSALAA